MILANLSFVMKPYLTRSCFQQLAYEPKFAEVGVTKKHQNLQTDIIDFYCNAVTALHFAKTSCVALLSPKGLILARVEIKQV